MASAKYVKGTNEMIKFIRDFRWFINHRDNVAYSNAYSAIKKLEKMLEDDNGYLNNTAYKYKHHFIIVRYKKFLKSYMKYWWLYQRKGIKDCYFLDLEYEKVMDKCFRSGYGS